MTADVECYRNNLRDELNGAALYEGLAAAETDALRQDLLLQLAPAWRRSNNRQRRHQPGGARRRDQRQRRIRGNRDELEGLCALTQQQVTQGQEI